MSITIEKLVRGSAEINRMRHEVELVIGLLVGRLDNAVLNRRPDPISIPCPDLTWTIEYRHMSAHVYAVCLMADTVIKGNKYVVYKREPRESRSQLYGNDVQLVHKSLQSLLDGLIQLSPRIEEELEFLVSAAE